MNLTQALNAVHLIQWKPAFVLTLCLMALHTIFFQESQHVVDLSESNTASNSPETVLTSAPIHAAPARDIHDDVHPLVVDGPEDHDFPPDAAPTPYIAICMAIKNQALDLQEFFVHHYHHLGMRRFYVMDDGSDPPLSTFEYPGVPRSVLTFVLQDPTTRASGHFEQIAIYARCIEHYGRFHTWMAFLDGDEFLETPGNETPRDILEGFEGNDTVGALAVNWKMHSSSGLLTRPESTRKSFVHCVWDDPDNGGKTSDNQHVKVIVRTDRAFTPKGPHMWHLKEGQTVGEHGDIVDSEAFRLPITRDRIALHHYVAKSRQEYEEKMHRGNAMDDPKGEEFWDALENKYIKEDCPEMAKYDP